MQHPDNHQPESNASPPLNLFDRLQRFLGEYAWIIVRNVLGWLLMLLALPIGFTLPGPFGLPLFLIGFALVTFPGKRKLTARVLRGRRLLIEDKAYAFVAAFISIAIPAIAWWIIWAHYEHTIRRWIEDYTPKKSVYVLTPILAILLTWLVTRLSLKILNGLLLLLPRFRRKFRPWLQSKGLKLLPPRRRRAPKEPLSEDEILEIDPKHHHRIRQAWQNARPWISRTLAIAVTIWIFVIMIRPLGENWPVVRGQIAAISLWRFVAASAMFAGFLLCFRAMTWRRVLKGFGFKLPYAAAARIWATSELARYLPGAIWQVVGRVYLCKPYGVPGAIVSTSQILEVCIFLFANVMIAGSCLLYFGAKMEQQARPWFITALVLVPMLGLILHPRVFYGVANGILRKLGKRPIIKRLRGKSLVELLLWVILGLVWQSAAVYLIVDPVLHLKPAWWWVMAGAYCLAWCAGFLAFWAPGGIGVRELVFVTTMQVISPADVKARFSDPAQFAALLVLVGFVLRLWTVVGELMLVLLAQVWDYRGALNLPDAPGRCEIAPPQVSANHATARGPSRAAAASDAAGGPS